MLDPAGFSAAPAPFPALSPGPSGVANSWTRLDDIEDEDDDGWNDSFDYAAHPGALNPFAAQSFVYPSDDSDDQEFTALVASVQNVTGAECLV